MWFAIDYILIGAFCGRNGGCIYRFYSKRVQQPITRYHSFPTASLWPALFLNDRITDHHCFLNNQILTNFDFQHPVTDHHCFPATSHWATLISNSQSLTNIVSQKKKTISDHHCVLSNQSLTNATFQQPINDQPWFPKPSTDHHHLPRNHLPTNIVFQLSLTNQSQLTIVPRQPITDQHCFPATNHRSP